MGFATYSILLLAAALGFLSQMNTPHDEAALLSDWSEPPPWPVFIGLNVLAGVLRGAADTLTPPPIKMLDMAMGYHTTILVYTAQKYKIPDLLTDGPMTAAAIASKINSEGPYVERFMFACAAHGVFKLGTPADNTSPRFVNTALSAVLRSDHPNSMRAMVGHNAEDVYAAWGALPDFLSKTDGPIPWDVANPKYPFAKGGIWAKFEELPASEDQFAAAMTSLDGLGANAMVADGPWAKFKRVVDVGGGKGHFMHRILETHPGITGINFDRAPVIEIAKKEWAVGGAFAAASARADHVAGSFFEAGSLPTAMDGDAYYMRYILHDWPTKDVLAILKNVRAAFGTAKATLVIGAHAGAMEEPLFPDRLFTRQDPRYALARSLDRGCRRVTASL